MANIFRVDRTNNKIEMGTTGTTIEVASHTALKTLALDGSKNLESIQDLRITASPTFVGGTFTGVVTIAGIGGSGLTGYDLKIGDTTTPDYGLIQTGGAAFGRVPYNAMSMDLDGSVIIRNLIAPATSNIEFAFLESGGTSVRFALAKSAVGNASYCARSMLIAGPSVWNDEIVTVGYWQGQGIFGNLACDTDGDGADLGVQNDLEVEGDIFVDSIKESTSGVGITFANNVLIAGLTNNSLIYPSSGVLTSLGVATNGQLPIGSTGATPVLATLSGTTDHISVSNGAGSITLDLDTNTKTLLGSFNGIFLERLDFTISEAGGTVTGSLEQDGGGDLIQRFSDGYTVLDCTDPVLTINLTGYVGSDAVPKAVFVYILQSAKTVMAASNSDWPATEHIKIANLLLKSAATTGSDGGALVNRNWNDFASAANGEGHITHIERRIRQEPSQWDSGVALTLKNSAGAALTTGNSSTAVEIVTTEGKVYQLHRHTFPVFDMYTVATDDAHIVNQPTDSGGAYVTTADLVTDITRYVDGTAAGLAIGTNKYFNLVLWGVQNRSGEPSHIMINLPTGQYTTEANATSDVDGTSVFDIPALFKGMGFLIARLTFRKIGGGQWTYIAQEDLRGQIPPISAGVSVTTTDHALLANLAFASAGHTGFQAQGDVLDDLNILGVVGANSEFLVGTGAGALAWEDAATAATSMGLGTGNSPQFTAVNIGHASDTTLTRVSAGVVAIEGTTIMVIGDAPTSHTIASHNDTTGTGAELNELTDGSTTILHNHATGADEKVKIDAAATAGYIGASPVDGVLRTSTGLNYTDGGNFITLSVDVGIEDDEIVQIDSGTVASNDYAQFTANGLKGRDYAEVLSDLSGQMDAAFNLNGQDLANGGVIFLTEQAAAEADVPDKGQVWVKTATPNILMFTDDAGTDFRLSADGDIPTPNDSEANAMLKVHAYLAQTSGFVDAFINNTVSSIQGYVGATNDPVGAGTLLQHQRANDAAADCSIHFFVANGKYFEILAPNDTPTINWTPLVSGGAAPIDQD